MRLKKQIYLVLLVFLPVFGCGKNEYFEDLVNIENIIQEDGDTNYIDTLKNTIEEFIVFNKRSDFRPVFRIPSLIISPKGTILVSCENRSEVADKGEIDILLARKSCEESDWDYQKVFINDSIRGRYMNPIFLIDKENGRVYLFSARLSNSDKYAVDHSTEEMDFVYKYSDDDGLTWSKEISIKSNWDLDNYSGVLPSPSNGIQSDNGSFYIPTMVVKKKKWRSGLLLRDEKHNWFFSTVTPNVGDNESTVYIDNAGRTVLDCRTFDGVRNKYFYNVQEDIFKKAPDNVIESTVNLKAEITKCILSGKELYLMSFANTKSNKRENLSLFASSDGIRWIHICIIENGSNHFAYSNVSCFNDKIFVTYETVKNIKLKDLSSYKDLIIKRVFDGK